MKAGFWEILLIVILVLVLFGHSKIPDLMKNLANGINIFKKELKGDGAAAEDKKEAEPEKDAAEKSPVVKDALAKKTRARKIAAKKTSARKTPAAAKKPAEKKSIVKKPVAKKAPAPRKIAVARKKTV